jgi:charged multivesicular body protein 1
LRNQAIQQGHEDIAKIYAGNAIRKQNEKINLLRLASRIDAVASRVQTAVTMQRVSMNIGEVVKGMDVAMNAMDLDKVCVSVCWRAGCLTKLDINHHGQVREAI